MNLGSWGDFVFEVRGDKVRTYDEYMRTTTGRWGLHEVTNGKPRPQFGGPGQDEISLVIRLHRSLGANPGEEAERLRRAVDEGAHAPFIRNGRPESQGDWYIESIEEADHAVSPRGVEYSELAVIMKEYF